MLHMTLAVVNYAIKRTLKHASQNGWSELEHVLFILLSQADLTTLVVDHGQIPNMEDTRVDRKDTYPP